MIPTILLVDVDSPNRAYWKAFLENQGFDVCAAGDAKTALEECRRLQPDLVLLHDTLADIACCDLCRSLKAQPANHLTPVVLVMNSASTEEAQRGREAGADDFWGIPQSRYEALSRIQILLQLKTYIDAQVRSVVLSLAYSIDSKHPSTAGHSERIADYAVRLAENLHLNDDDVEILRMASLLHDIGNVGVPDYILTKPGPLTLEERAVMNQHPVLGESICAPLRSLRRVLPVIRHHHERLDGSGYPDGLRARQIPLKARILQIADIYDALITDRPYRQAMSRQDALQVLSREAGCGWLDTSLVERFCALGSEDFFVPRGRSMLASYYA
jgi:putative two-component system response regulator